MKNRLLAVALALALSACGGTPAATPNPEPTPEPQRLTGSVTLYGSEPGPSDEIDADAEGVVYSSACAGAGGYSDIKPGAQVTVHDGGGELLAVGRVTEGTYRIANAQSGEEMDLEDTLGDDTVGDPDLNEYDDWSYIGRCELDFTVELPAEASEFYSVEVADRGELTYSHAELEAQGWDVDLELGGG